MRIEVVRAWSRRFESIWLELPPGATVAEALEAARLEHEPETVAYAIFGVRATRETVLREGDRVELLRPLQADPKDARRRRAESKAKTRP